MHFLDGSMPYIPVRQPVLLYNALFSAKRDMPDGSCESNAIAIMVIAPDDVVAFRLAAQEAVNHFDPLLGWYNRKVDVKMVPVREVLFVASHYQNGAFLMMAGGENAQI